MRTIFSIGLGLVAVAGLAACGKTDEAVRTEARTRLATNCPRAATPEITAMLTQAGVTMDQVCSCTVDRYMRSVTVAQITEDSASPAPARISAASAQCASELVAAAQSHGPAPATETAPAANETGAAQEPADTEGDAANEAH